LKIGVGRPKGDVPVYDHVLTRFHPDDRRRLEAVTFTSACDAIRGVLVQGLDKTMTAVNDGGANDGEPKPKSKKKKETGTAENRRTPLDGGAASGKRRKVHPAVVALVRDAVTRIVAREEEGIGETSSAVARFSRGLS
jgi:hypothetical protein